MKKIFIQCGYEDKCKNKDCLNCPRKNKHTINMTLAEEICVEDFAMIDLKLTEEEQLDLMQDIMRKLMKKIYK